MRSFGKQFGYVIPILLIIYLITFLSLLAGILASTVKGVSLDTLTIDPTAVLNGSFYIGAFSNIGVMLWSGSIALCFFAAYRLSLIPSMRFQYFFMIGSGLVSLMLGIDDLFLVHEYVFPHYFAIPKNAVFLTYANLIFIYLLYFRKAILNTDYIILCLAFCFMGLAAVSKIFQLPIPKDSFLEDSLKLFGIVSWFAYYFRTTNEMISRTTS